MPWEIKKTGDQWCVYKKGESSPIKGGCHGTKKEAEDHMKALYANTSDAAASYFVASGKIDTQGGWRTR